MAVKNSANFESLKEKILNEMENPYETLKKSFELFGKKWVQQQQASPFDKKEIDDLILEALSEAIEASKKK